jgi:drug/metabolite transporter (DMT)-like permease
MLQVFFGALIISWVPILVKLSGFDPSWSAFWRCALGALFLAPLVIGRHRLGRLSRGEWTFLALGGAFFAVDLFSWHHSIHYVGAGLATILGNTQVFWLAIYGALAHKEKLRPAFLAGMGLAFGGLMLMLELDRIGHPEHQHYGPGVALGVLTGFCYAGFVVCLRKSRAENLRPESSLFWISGISALFLFFGSLPKGTALPPEPLGWLWIGMVALGAQVIAWILITRNLPHVPISRAGLILLCQPALAFFWGILILGEPWDLVRLAGAVMTLVGIHLGVTGRTGSGKPG